MRNSLTPQAAGSEQRNRILDALSSSDFALLQPHLEPVRLKFRQQLEWADRKVADVYFPESGVASVLVSSGCGHRQTEVAVVGREGMTGLPVVLGADRSPYDVLIQIEGDGQRISADNVRAAMDQSATLLACFLRFANVFLVQCAHTALANAHAKLEERLARWLVMAQDRIEGDQLMLTHDFLALMLGTRRAGVTIALRRFERKGVIRTARGAVTLKDRKGLEACAKGLYGRPEAEFQRVFGSPVGASTAGRVPP